MEQPQKRCPITQILIQLDGPVRKESKKNEGPKNGVKRVSPISLVFGGPSKSRAKWKNLKNRFLDQNFWPFQWDCPVRKNQTVCWRFGRGQFDSFLQNHQNQGPNGKITKIEFLVEIRAAAQNGRFGWSPDLAQPKSGKPF